MALNPHHPDKGPFVHDLNPGDRFTGFFVARYKQLEPFRDRSRGMFLTLTLADRTGHILGRVWEGAEELATTFQQGDVLKVAGDVEKYLDRTQVIVAKLRPAQSGEYDLRDFQPATDKNVDEMLAQLRTFVDGIGNPHLAGLVRYFFDDPEFVEVFAQAPAARRVHHAYLGGLLEHTLHVAQLAETLLELYPELDPDLLLTGVLLHDIGKVHEFTWQADIDYSDQGRLLGHLVLGIEMVTPALEQLPQFPDELALRVKHMLVSHHGRHEWGAPRRPKTLEAMALHHLEDLDAQVNRIGGLLAARRDPARIWTEYDRLLGRSLYAGRADDDLAHAEDSLEP